MVARKGAPHPEVDVRVFDVMHEILGPAPDARSTDVGKTLVKSV
jgi:hypothetical protein